jgi:prevent-host-death family protein
VKSATAKELRQKTAALLAEVRRGRQIAITYRGRPIAVLAPIDKTPQLEFEATAFGIWKGRRDMRSVGKWLDRVRAARYET